jgi:preprotein translocase SecE subunit
MASGIYKTGQGYYTRMGTTIGASLLMLLALYWLWGYASLIRVGSVNPQYVAASIVILIGALLTGLLYYFVFVSPRFGDFLIATEGEMKKVNWSTRREIFGSTAVVIFLMIVLTAAIFFCDQLFVWIFQQMGVLEFGS